MGIVIGKHCVQQTGDKKTDFGNGLFGKVKLYKYISSTLEVKTCLLYLLPLSKSETLTLFYFNTIS